LQWFEMVYAPLGVLRPVTLKVGGR
jgi:hypothetical protein